MYYYLFHKYKHNELKMLKYRDEVKDIWTYTFRLLRIFKNVNQFFSRYLMTNTGVRKQRVYVCIYICPINMNGPQKQWSVEYFWIRKLKLDI